MELNRQRKLRLRITEKYIQKCNKDILIKKYDRAVKDRIKLLHFLENYDEENKYLKNKIKLLKNEIEKIKNEGIICGKCLKKFKWKKKH